MLANAGLHFPASPGYCAGPTSGGQGWISGEGQALLEKGAIEKAKRNLARLENVCGRDCTETRDLAAALARGPVERVVTAEGAKPAPVATN